MSDNKNESDLLKNFEEIEATYAEAANDTQETIELFGKKPHDLLLTNRDFKLTRAPSVYNPENASDAAIQGSLNTLPHLNDAIATIVPRKDARFGEWHLKLHFDPTKINLDIADPKKARLRIHDYYERLFGNVLRSANDSLIAALKKQNLLVNEQIDFAEAEYVADEKAVLIRFTPQITRDISAKSPPPNDPVSATLALAMKDFLVAKGINEQKFRDFDQPLAELSTEKRR